MQLFQFTKEHGENFEIRQETDKWVLVVENIPKTKLFNDFCIQLLQKSTLRPTDLSEARFSEAEVSLIIKYFTLNGYTVSRKDTNLEAKLKQALCIITKDEADELSEAIGSMSYHDQIVLANQIME